MTEIEKLVERLRGRPLVPYQAAGMEWDAPDADVAEAADTIERLLAALKGAEGSSPVAHASDCAVHNAPAYPTGPCDCGALPTRPREQEGAADDRDAVLAAVLHEFGPDGCAKVLARLPEAKDYVKALRKPARPREPQVEAGTWPELLGDRNNNGGFIRDLCFTAFAQAKRPNSEDGGESDWFNDTLPKVNAGIEKIRAMLPTRPREQEGAEPVAWLYRFTSDGPDAEWKPTAIYPDPELLGTEIVPLYAHPSASFQAGAEAMREAAAKVCDAEEAAMMRVAEFHQPPRVEGDPYLVDIHTQGAMVAGRLAEKLRELPIPASSEGR